MSEEANGLFKGLNLSQDQAQSLVDFYIKHTKEAAEAPYKTYNDMRQGWQQEAFKDTELGTGQSLKPEVKESIGRTLDSLGEAGTAFRQAMDLTGAGDHPAVLKAMFQLSKMLIEGKHVSGASPSPQGQGKPGAAPTPAQALYPNLPSSAS